MSVYSQYATGASVDVAVDESYDGLVGIYRMIEESALNEHAIFEHVIACDFAEAYTKNGAMNESSLEAINEASASEIWGKVKEFLKKMWEKILGVIQNLITKIGSVFIRDGKELVKKYEKKINEKMNTSKLNKMPVKYKKLKTGSNIVNPSADAETFKNSIVKAINDSELGSHYSTDVDNANTAHGLAPDDKEAWSARSEEEMKKDDIRPYTTDEISDLKDKALTKINGGSSTDSKSFAKDQMEEAFDDHDEEGFTSTDFSYCKVLLENSKGMLTYLKKEKTNAEKQYREDIKAIEEIQKKHTKSVSDKHYSVSAGLARAYASRAISLNSARSAVLGSAFASRTAIYKKAFSEARALWVKAASYGGKAESTFLEAVAEVSDWEVEEMFAM